MIDDQFTKSSPKFGYQTRNFPARRQFLTNAGSVTAFALATGFTNMNIAHAEDQKLRLRKAYVEGPYGQIHYRYVKPDEPKHIPLLCLHLTPMSGAVYSNWILEMGKDRWAIAPDTPGYGSSDPPPQPVHIPDFAAAMIQLMDQLGIDQFDVMGYHTGSMTSTELARSYPDRIRKVVMISAPLFTQEELDTYRQSWYGDVNSRGGEHHTFSTALTELAGRHVGGQKTGWRNVGSDERYGEIMLEWLRSYRTEHWGHEAAFAYDLSVHLPHVKQPVLVLCPEDDLWVHTHRITPYLKTGRLHELPGWTHGAMDIHTAEMADIVKTFLDQN